MHKKLIQYKFYVIYGSLHKEMKIFSPKQTCVFYARLGEEWAFEGRNQLMWRFKGYKVIVVSWGKFNKVC